MLKIRTVIYGTAVALGLANPVMGQPTMTDDDRAEAIGKLPWSRMGTYNLPLSGSTLALPQGYVATFGTDAQHAYKLLGNPAERSGMEALVIGGKDADQIMIFESFQTGYVTLDDWSQVDPAALLAEIDRNTERENQERRQQGVPELHVKGWLQPPTLDRNTATTYWTIAAEETTGTSVNSVALRLGRNGFEKLTWITLKDKYLATGNRLDEMLRAQSFGPGTAYADHVSTDKMAEYGIAALVATVLGAKAVKAGAAAGLGVALAKFFPAVFGGVGAVFYGVIRRLRRKKPEEG
jgi:uncharacterized membrane-anchored protein